MHFNSVLTIVPNVAFFAVALWRIAALRDARAKVDTSLGVFIVLKAITCLLVLGLSAATLAIQHESTDIRAILGSVGVAAGATNVIASVGVCCLLSEVRCHLR